MQKLNSVKELLQILIKINANSSETFIVNEISKLNSSSVTEKVDEKSKVSASNTFMCHENVECNFPYAVCRRYLSYFMLLEFIITFRSLM